MLIHNNLKNIYKFKTNLNLESMKKKCAREESTKKKTIDL
jgi:hypothetical protein